MKLPLSLTLAAVVASAALHVAAQDSTDPKYTIKDHEARTGSKFRRDVVRSEGLPLNLPYDKLSESQKNALKSRYEAMGPNDEPPFPETGLMAIMTELNEAQKILQVRGRMVLHAQVNAEGKVTTVAVAEPTGTRMDVYAAGVLMRSKFKPARCDGVACNQDYLFEVNWDVSRN